MPDPGVDSDSDEDDGDEQGVDDGNGESDE